MDLFQSFQQFNYKHQLWKKQDRLLLAVSGGVDSVVLSHLCKAAGVEFSIAHCNFQLRGNDSIRDEAFVEALAKRLEVQCYIQRFDTRLISTQQKTSVEETARHLRYQWFEELRLQNGFDYILTAHHSDDHVETVLMNFFRGTGIRGLHGILPKKNKIIRPLLFTDKATLLNFAAANKLEFVVDYTNAENEYTRNYFRNELIPSLQKVFPSVVNNMIDNIEKFKDVEILYDQAIEKQLHNLIEKKGNEIHIPLLKLLKTVPLQTVLYELLKPFGFNTNQAQEVIHLLSSESGKLVHSNSHRVFSNRKWLIIAPLKTESAQHILIDQPNQSIDFELGQFKLEHLPIQPIEKLATVVQLDAEKIKFPLLLRPWKKGDYFYPLGLKKEGSGKAGKKKISRFLMDQKLSISEKEKVWVLESNKKICWVVGLRIDERVKITHQTKSIIKCTFLLS